MKTKIITALILGSLFLTGCSAPQIKEQNKPIKNIKEEKISFFQRINQSVKQQGAMILEINNPKLALPAAIDSGQIKKYFKIDNLLLALVLRNSANVVLSLPADFTPAFVGILAAKEGDAQWSKLVEIKDAEAMDKNNPYYLMVENQKLLLTVVDQNGAGSGEGMMKVFALSSAGNWELESCYYFGGSYNNSAVNGDYFAFSTKFSEQKIEPVESCKNAQLITM